MKNNKHIRTDALMHYLTIQGLNSVLVIYAVSVACTQYIWFWSKHKRKTVWTMDKAFFTKHRHCSSVLNFK